MVRQLARLFLLFLPVLVTSCASPVVVDKLSQIDQSAGYQYNNLEKDTPKAIPRSAVLMAFSGGGTRAAALSDGALQALAETKLPNAGSVPLSSQIDVISSVSGGSVTAAAYALRGIGGLAGYEKGFLHGSPTGDMVASVVLNPTRLAVPRIGILESYFEKQLFGENTFQNLIDDNKSTEDRRPYIILNATDVASDAPFPFTQDRFDLICANLTKLKLADAVAASAAFPIALSALTIKNNSPCRAQNDPPAKSGWRPYGDHWAPLHVINDLDADRAAAVAYPKAGKVDNYRRGTVDLSYLNPDGSKNFVQLLDGGLADNVALTMPYRLMTSNDESPSILDWIDSGKIDKLLLVVVNARNQAKNDYGTQPSSPGIVGMTLASIDTPMDATTFQLIDRVSDLLNSNRLNGPGGQHLDQKAIVVVDFDYIADPVCRDHFHQLPTSWGLPDPDIDDLIDLGKAMVLQSPKYQDIIKALGAVPPTGYPTVADICQRIAARKT
jgi:NTE family protein